MSTEYLSKVVPLPRLLGELQEARGLGKTIVQCHGCFDIVHPGHIRHLGFARAQGDILVISITADDKIHKGYNRPYVPQSLRAENLAALELVDFVVICTEPTATALLAQTRPDIYVKGREYETSNDPRFLEERRVVEEGGGKIIFSSGDVVFSSTQIVQELRQDPTMQQAKLTGICQRHGINLQRLVRRLTDMTGTRVTVLGDLLVERHIHCDVQDLSTEGPMPRLRPIATHTRLMGAAHAARCAKRLGADVRLIGTIGDDEQSREIHSQLEEEGIRTRLFATRDRMLQRTCYMIDDRPMFEVDASATHPPDTVLQRDILDAIESDEDPADLLILTDLGYDLLTRSLAVAVCKAARPRTRLIAVEASGPAGGLGRFTGIDLACPTERQLRRSANDASSGLSAVAASLMQTRSITSMIVRLGRRGVVAFDGREMLDSADAADRLRSEWLPSFAPTGMDGAAAGAVLLTTSSLAICAGADLPEAAYLASTAAALRDHDNTPPSPGEITRLLTARPELSQQTARTATADPTHVTEQIIQPRRTPPSRSVRHKLGAAPQAPERVH